MLLNSKFYATPRYTELEFDDEGAVMAATIERYGVPETEKDLYRLLPDGCQPEADIQAGCFAVRAHPPATANILPPPILNLFCAFGEDKNSRALAANIA